MIKNYKKYIFFAGLLLAIVLLISYTGIRNYINLAYIKDHRRVIAEFIEKHYTTAAILYSSLYTCLVFFMISLTLVLTIIAGFFFGTIPATLLSILGALIGGIVSLLTIRYLLNTWLTTRYNHAVETFKEKFQKHGASYLLSLHLFPLTPIGLINIMAGLSNVSLFTFLWTTAVGILPITLLCSFAGRQLATINSVKDILSPSILFILLALSLCALLPSLLEYFKK